MSRDGAAGQRTGRLARLRERWRNASLKTSFMAYMLAYLVAALVLSTLTGSVFAELQNRVVADAYELSGLYLYDDEDDALVPARLVDVTEDGNTLFVQTVRDGETALPRADLPESTNVTDASDYRFSAASLELPGAGNGEANGDAGTAGTGSSESAGSSASSGERSDADAGAPDLSMADLPTYDAWARAAFRAWLAEHPGSPYASFFSAESGEAQGGSDTTGLLVSAVGYYLSTPPSAGASALSTLFGLLTFFMFPLWFGACIFAAARRFYRMRLAPGLSTLDAAATKIAAEDLNFHVSYDRADEMGRLASSFETMRASLAESQRALWRTAEERKRLNAAFAHDLRTPLTILKGKVELLEAHLQAGDAAPERLEASVASLAVQVERLERYVAAMSGLQKLEDRAAQPTAQPFDTVLNALADIGGSLCRAQGGEGGSAGRRVAFGLFVSARCDAERPTLVVDRALVEEVAENLVGNAARYAASRVDVRVDVRDGFFVLAVEDDGPGFSDDALAQGCAPFFSETPSKDHFGLGLNIASLLCGKHGGSLTLGNRAEGGACATARLLLEIAAR